MLDSCCKCCDITLGVTVVLIGKQASVRGKEGCSASPQNKAIDGHHQDWTISRNGDIPAAIEMEADQQERRTAICVRHARSVALSG